MSHEVLCLRISLSWEFKFIEVAVLDFQTMVLTSQRVSDFSISQPLETDGQLYVFASCGEWVTAGLCLWGPLDLQSVSPPRHIK